MAPRCRRRQARIVRRILVATVALAVFPAMAAATGPAIVSGASATIVVTGTITHSTGIALDADGRAHAGSTVPVTIHRQQSGQTLVVTAIPR
jgi:hypothetical protein